MNSSCNGSLVGDSVLPRDTVTREGQRAFRYYIADYLVGNLNFLLASE